MAKQIMEYELLISCPSDVQAELNIITETVDTFNRLFGSVNNARIVTKHWSKDSYPQSGGSPQKLLNDQFVLKCDAAVAVFWTRFGTPTDDYGSGTEEEIEELLKSGKQVFLYFSDCPVSLSQVDNDQYEKVKAFRNKYKERGLFWTYSDVDIFRKDFLNHLTLYFVNLLEGNKVDKRIANRSDLSLKGVINEKLFDKASTFHTQYSNNKHVKSLKEKAVSLIGQINNIELPQETLTGEAEKIIAENNDKEEYPDISIGELNKLPKVQIKKLSEHFSGLKELYPMQSITITERLKEEVNRFAEENNIRLNDSFYYLGNLSKYKYKNNFITGFGQTTPYDGTEEEKSKFELLSSLEDVINEHKESLKYFAEIDNKNFINLALCNFGTDYDEDIDVKIYVKKNYICYPENLPFPDFECIDIGINSFEIIYKPVKTVIIDEYPDYYYAPYVPHIPSLPVGLLGGKSYEAELKEKTDDFNENRDRIFCYDVFSNEEYDIFCYNQKYLKQNTNSFLPSFLVFDKNPDVIKYEITSKRFPEVINGELVIE